MKVVLSLAFAVMFSAGAMSQGLTRVSMDKGQRFIATLIPGLQSPTEKPIPRPLEFIATSEFAGKVRFRTMDPQSAVKIDTTLQIVPNGETGGYVKLSVSTTMVVSATKRKAKIAFEITSDVPISLSSRRQWMGGGEDIHILPVEHLGTKYRAISMPSDVYGVNQPKWMPGYFVVIGANDATEVKLTSKLKLVDPLTSAELPRNVTHTYTIDAGDVLLFEQVIDTSLVHKPEQDLTGTYIESTQPIGVLSGHLKGAVGTTHRELPPTGLFRAEAHFTRNNLAEMMPPINMADTLFVVTPFAYTPTRVGWKHKDSAHGMVVGDIIKFVATENTTFIYKRRPKDPSRILLGVINEGEMLSDSSLFEPATYWCSKPVLAAQFGRSYGKIYPVGTSKDHTPNIQGHPTVEAGMPAMSMVVPENRWVTSASWLSPEQMDNFCSIVFHTGDAGYIKWNGRPLTELGVATEIWNTPFSCLTSAVTAVMNTIVATKDDVRFNVLPQSSNDGLQQGRALAQPTGFDNSTPGIDSIVIAEDMLPQSASNCGVREATATLNGPNSIATVFAVERTNYRLELAELTSGAKTASYRIVPINAKVAGTIVVRVVATSGAISERRYSYDPPATAVVVATVPPTIGINIAECFDVTITNPGLEVLEISKISFLQRGELDIQTPLPLHLDPGASQTISCCYTPRKVGKETDTLVIAQSCYDVKVREVSFTVATPLIAVEDADFGNVEAAVPPITKNVQILNRMGGVKMEVSDIRWREATSDPHFQFDTSGLGLPVILEQGQSLSLPITYHPNGDVGKHAATIRVMSSSTGGDSVIFCTAESKTVSSVEEESAVINLHPVPVRIGGTLQAQLPPSATVRVVDLQGRELDRRSVSDNGQLEIHVSADRYHVGVYHLVVTTPDYVKTYRWIVQ